MIAREQLRKIDRFEKGNDWATVIPQSVFHKIKNVFNLCYKKLRCYLQSSSASRPLAIFLIWAFSGSKHTFVCRINVKFENFNEKIISFTFENSTWFQKYFTVETISDLSEKFEKRLKVSFHPSGVRKSQNNLCQKSQYFWI